MKKKPKPRRWLAWRRFCPDTGELDYVSRTKLSKRHGLTICDSCEVIKVTIIEEVVK